MSQALADAPELARSEPTPEPSLLARANRLGPLPLAGLAVLAACTIALALTLAAGVHGVRAVPSVVRTGVIGIALFAVCGYPAAVAVARGALRAHRALLVLPLGAAVSSLTLAVLGLLHVPLKVSLAILIVCAAVAALRARRSSGEAVPREGSPLLRIALPLLLAAIVAMISLTPIFRAGFATVPGQNGDAILVVGSAALLEHAPPTANRTDLPIDHIPLEWRSKYPIYYPLAAIATLADQDPIAVFAPVSALLLAFTGLGFFLFALYALRAPPWIALLALFLVPLDRIAMYVTIHPYYNELWGQFTLPFILLAGWRFLTEPSRWSAALFACFGLLGLLAYPLMVVFPLFFLFPAAWSVWRRRRALGLGPGWISALRIPSPRARPLLWIPAVVVAVPVAAVLVRGFFEKTLSALSVLAPGTNLAGWSAPALGYLPWPRFVGMPGSSGLNLLGLAVVCMLACLGLARIRPQSRVPMMSMVGICAVIGVYFRIRSGGQLFFFRDLAFLGPYVLLLALIELGALASASGRPRAVLGMAGIAAALVVVPASSAREIDATFDNATPSVLALRGWNRELAAGTSIRIDLPPTGYQLWVTYMFTQHPLSVLHPLGGFFPHAPRGRKADYIITERPQSRPTDAIGRPLLQNAQFELWRMNPAVPGPDRSSRHLIDDSKVTVPLG